MTLISSTRLHAIDAIHWCATIPSHPAPHLRCFSSKHNQRTHMYGDHARKRLLLPARESSVVSLYSLRIGRALPKTVVIVLTFMCLPSTRCSLMQSTSFLGAAIRFNGPTLLRPPNIDSLNIKEQPLERQQRARPRYFLSEPEATDV